jgi:hypothetical protein
MRDSYQRPSGVRTPLVSGRQALRERDGPHREGARKAGIAGGFVIEHRDVLDFREEPPALTRAPL